MTVFQLSAAMLAFSLLTSCATVGKLIQAPFSLLNKAVAESAQHAGDAGIEATEAERAQPALQSDKPAESVSVTASTLVAR